MADAPPCPACGGPTAFVCRAILYPGAERDARECAACASAFYWPVPSFEDIARCYPPAYYGGFFRQYWKDYYKGRALAARLSRWRPDGDFLDVGCALGTLAAGVRDHSRWRARGLEFSARAAQLGQGLNGMEISAAPLSSAPFENESFDFIHINNVLEHESDPGAALAAAARLLRPGGRLELTVPNGPVDFAPNKTLFRRWGRAVPTRHGGHLYFFSRRGLRALLAARGFRVLSARSFHFKLGAKARGLWPGAYKRFAKPAPPPGDAGVPPELTLEQGRALIPPAPSWPLYAASHAWRRAWRLSWSDFGYDFEIAAERR